MSSTLGTHADSGVILLADGDAAFIAKALGDIGAGNGTVLLDVMNRGRKQVFRYFNVAAATNDPRTEADFGDGFLLHQGFTLLFVGWQFDVPEQAGLMRAYLPVATDGGEPIEGLERSDFVVRQPVFDRSLGDRRHIPYAVVNPDDPRNTLAVRDAPAGERTLIPRDAWQFGRLEPRRDAGCRLTAQIQWRRRIGHPGGQFRTGDCFR